MGDWCNLLDRGRLGGQMNASHLPLAAPWRNFPMPKLNGNQITPGTVIEHQGGLWVAVKSTTVKPGKGGAFNQVELKISSTAASSTSAFAPMRRSKRSNSN